MPWSRTAGLRRDGCHVGSPVVWPSRLPARMAACPIDAPIVPSAVRRPDGWPDERLGGHRLRIISDYVKSRRIGQLTAHRIARSPVGTILGATDAQRHFWPAASETDPPGQPAADLPETLPFVGDERYVNHPKIDMTFTSDVNVNENPAEKRHVNVVTLPETRH